MGLKVEKNFFRNKADIYEDLNRTGFWPTTFVSGPSEGLQPHWHSEEVQAYVLEGETSFLDVESGKELPISQGDKITVPAQALHAEGVVKDRIVYILALPEPLESDQFLLLRDAEELPHEGSVP